MQGQGRGLGIILSSVLLAAACTWGCSEQPRESSSTQTQRIINGTTLTLPTHRHVFITDDKGHTGSGTILNDEWVLTAAHVVAEATNAAAVTVLTDSTADLPPRHGSEVRVHPLYLGNPNRPQDIDIALVRVDRAFTAVTPLTLSNVPTSQVVGSNVDCFGYGRFKRGLNQLRNLDEAPPLHSAQFMAQPFAFNGQLEDPVAFQLVLPLNAAPSPTTRPTASARLRSSASCSTRPRTRKMRSRCASCQKRLRAVRTSRSPPVSSKVPCPPTPGYRSFWERFNACAWWSRSA